MVFSLRTLPLLSILLLAGCGQGQRVVDTQTLLPLNNDNAQALLLQALQLAILRVEHPLAAGTTQTTSKPNQLFVPAEAAGACGGTYTLSILSATLPADDRYVISLNDYCSPFGNAQQLENGQVLYSPVISSADGNRIHFQFDQYQFKNPTQFIRIDGNATINYRANGDVHTLLDNLMITDLNDPALPSYWLTKLERLQSADSAGMTLQINGEIDWADQGKLLLRTDQPLHWQHGQTQPQQGSITLTGANGAQLTLTFSDASAQWQLNQQAPVTMDAAQLPASWN
ncbi:MAG: hypothetical protein OEW58_10290 [Gammaproteobacteria bacterium]|nr:hypothetical protein [Gammaproteobacteria bacterium]